MQTGGRNRAAIVGVGGWGARVVAHLWPRLRMADRGRALTPASPAGLVSDMSLGLSGGSMRLPRLGNMVSHALVLPGEDGSLTIARPQPEQWDDVGFAHHRLSSLPDAVAAGASPFQSVRQLRRETYRNLWPTLDIIGHYAAPKVDGEKLFRRSLFYHFLHNRLAIATDLAAIIEQARADENEPDEETSEITIFVVVALADELASAILWPLANLLRERVGSRVLAEQIGVLSTGVYAPPPERRQEEAAVHVAVSELAYLTRLAAGMGPEQPSPLHEHLLGTTPEGTIAPPFDRTYLVDREKTSGALVKDEGELTTVVGNALEAFLSADANVYLRNALAPDAADLLRTGPYSSLGAACIYVPLEEMWTQARQRMTLRLLRDHFLAPLPEDTQTMVVELADRFVQTHLHLPELVENLLESNLVQVAEPETTEDGAAATGQLPGLQVEISPLEVGTPASLTVGDLAGRVATINETYDRFEREQLAAWAADVERRSLTLVSPPPQTNGRQAEPDVLRHLDDEVLALMTTHDQGLEAARAYVAQVLKHLRQQQGVMRQQRRRQRRRSDGDEADVLQRRLARIDTSVLRGRLPAWPLTLLGISLLALVGTALVLWNRQMETGRLLGWSAAVAVVVLVVGLAARLAYQQWLRGSLQRVVELRQERLDRLARAHLADALETLYAGVIDDVVRRQEALEETLAQLRRHRDGLADRLSKPLLLPHSFVRQPLAQEDIYDDIRLQATPAPTDEIALKVFRANPASLEAVRQAWQHTVHPSSEQPTDNGVIEPPRISLAEALSLAIERYAARLSQPEAPADVNVEDLLPRVVPEYSASDFLADLRLKAKPLIHLDDRVVAAPISIDLMASPFAMAMQSASPAAHAPALRLRLLSSYDPFSLILVRTLHGLPLEAVGSLRTYAESFASLSPEQQDALILSEALMATPESAAVAPGS